MVLRKFFFLFIPWWRCLSPMGLLLLLVVKLFIVYLGTISLSAFHCTGVWGVYSCTIYQRLAFENMFGGEVYFTRPRKKRNLKTSIVCTSKRRGGGQEGLCIFFLLMVICFSWVYSEKRDLERESFNLNHVGEGGGVF